MRTNNPKLRLFIISVMMFMIVLRFASSACCMNPDSEYLCNSETSPGVDITAQDCCKDDTDCIKDLFDGTDDNCVLAEQMGLCEKVCCCLEEDTEEAPIYAMRCIFNAYEKYAKQLDDKLSDEELYEYITDKCIKLPTGNCKTVCGNVIPIPTPTVESTANAMLKSFDVDTVDSKRKIAITWGLEMPANTNINYLYLYRCESQGGVCISEFESFQVPNVGFYEDSGVFFGKCYSYYLSVKYTNLATGIQSSQSFDELKASDCVGSEKCLNKKLFSLFCVDDNIYSCEQDNTIVDHKKPCSLADSFCSDSSGKLGIFTNSCENENTKYYCYSDKAPSGINYCYDCVKNKQFIECYDYKSKDACQNNNCNVGGSNGCTWKPLVVNSLGVDLGVCVDEAKDNCNYCGKLFATIVPSSQLPNAGNSLLFSKCNDALLPLLSVDEFSCARTMYCFENNVQSCFDYKDESHCTYDECNINAHCTWSNGQCGKDINEDGILDCEGLAGTQRVACENDIFPPNSNIGVVGSLADVLNMNLTFSITDKTKADSAPQKVENFATLGYKLFICSVEPNSAGSKIPICMGSTPGSASGGISYVGSEIPNVISLVNLGFFDYGKVNKIKYYAQDPAKNYQLTYNTLNIDLRGLEPCDGDLDCEYEGICSDIKRECVNGIYVNTCEIKRQLFELDPLKGYEEIEESCDGLDNNCDGEVDEGLAQYCYLDSDGDKFGDPFNKTSYCDGDSKPNSCVDNNLDCNDTNSSVFFGAYEGVLDGSCFDGIDNNCDGKIDREDPNCPLFDCNCGDSSIGKPDYCPDFDQDIGGCTCFCDNSQMCTCGPDHFDMDLDGDGIPNLLDSEKTKKECVGNHEVNKPNNPYVDERGVALDKDGDAVCDGADKCPTTVPGCAVVTNLSNSKAGCPKDCTDFNSPCSYDPYCSQCVSCSDCGGGNENYCTNLICLKACGEGQCCVFNKTKSVFNLDFGNCYDGSEFKGSYCSNEIRDTFTRETDVDCGGCVCDPCELGKACLENSDCESDFCNLSNRCDNKTYWENLCSNEKLDSFETDTDCGGICIKFNKACEPGAKCKENSDCMQGSRCQNNVCVSEAYLQSLCSNSKKDSLNGETDVDCGGEYCLRCEEGKSCIAGADCLSGICFNKECAVNKQVTCYFDADNDGYGNSSNKTKYWLLNETPPVKNGVKCALNGGDCNDNNKNINPGFNESYLVKVNGVTGALCFDEIDNDCDGNIDLGDSGCPIHSCNCDLPGVANDCSDFDRDILDCDCFCSNKPGYDSQCVCGPDYFDNDKDGDGVLNIFDVQEFTPIECNGGRVNVRSRYISFDGVAFDTDADGVCNGADICEDTPIGCVVNKNLSTDTPGCALSCVGYPTSPCSGDKMCSDCKSCVNCGLGNPQLCTQQVCLSCGNCTFTATNQSTTGIIYGNCTPKAVVNVSTACKNQIKDNDETDIDCGGVYCEGCAIGKLCKLNSDCSSGACSASTGKCVANTVENATQTLHEKCSNGKQDSDEADKDCGGVCNTLGKKCDLYQFCYSGDDCAQGECIKGTCTPKACQGTGTNCGGDCVAKCMNGESCLTDSDCMSNYCSLGKCQKKPQETPEDEKEGGGFGFLIVILIILLIGVAVVVYFLFFTGPNQKKNQKKSTIYKGSAQNQNLAKQSSSFGGQGQIPQLKRFDSTKTSIRKEPSSLKGADVFALFEDKDSQPKDSQPKEEVKGNLDSKGESRVTPSSESSIPKSGWYTQTRTTENIELKKIMPSPTLKGSDGASKKIDPEKQKVINKLEDVVGKNVSTQKSNDFDKLSSLSVDDENHIKNEIGLTQYPKTKIKSTTSVKSKKMTNSKRKPVTSKAKTGNKKSSSKKSISTKQSKK